MFTSIVVFETKPTEPIVFTCLGCDWNTEQHLGEVTYLNRHLRLYCKNQEVSSWYSYYKNRIQTKKAVLSNELLDFIMLFITSNSCLDILNNRYYQKILKKAKIEIVGEFAFRNTILPNIKNNLHEAIENKLQNEYSVCLIVDLWSSKSNDDYIGLCAVLTNFDFERELLAINMMRMIGSHDAENIKQCIETMINFYKFNKSKIKSINIIL